MTSVARPGSEVFTDGHRGYDSLKSLGFEHGRVMHSAGEYVRGRVSTNGIENYWSLLKRTYIGTYHYWSDDHLARYVDVSGGSWGRPCVAQPGCGSTVAGTVRPEMGLQGCRRVSSADPRG